MNTRKIFGLQYVLDIFWTTLLIKIGLPIGQDLNVRILHLWYILTLFPNIFLKFRPVISVQDKWYCIQNMCDRVIAAI